MKRIESFIGVLLLSACLPLHGAPARVDIAALEASLDQFFAEQLPALHVPGAAFVMVKDGKVVLSRGYGFANRKNQGPFDADTIVRAGSIVKTITATAALQLAEAGHLDLDADINQYLSSFQVPATFSDPVTTRQLLHYTGGFDSRFFGIRTVSESRIVPLGNYLRTRMPPRVRAPGIIRAYNDHEIALAALVVQEISGQGFATYVREHIFEPLAMRSSSLTLPPDDVERAAVGYGATAPYPFSFYYLHNAPGAGFNTTPTDIANYMIMHLGKGRFRGRQILGAESLRQMHQTNFTHHPRLPGIAFSFDENFRGEHRYLAKSGGAPGFMNRMMLFPDDRVGIYFVYNRDSTVPLARRLETALLDRLYPNAAATPRLEPVAATPAELERYAGRYVDLNDYSHRSIERLGALMNQVLVQVNPDATLTAFGANLEPVEEDLFQWTQSGTLAAFRSDINGNVSHLFVNRTAFAHLPWFEAYEVQMGLLGFAVLVFFLCSLFWLYGIVRGYHTHLALPGLMGLVNLVFLGALTHAFRSAVTSSDPPWELSFDPPVSLLVTMALPFAGAAFGALILLRAVANAGQRHRPFLSKLADLPVIVAEAGFLFFLFTWNLLGIHF